MRLCHILTSSYLVLLSSLLCRSQVLRVHRDPDAPRGHPHGRRHPGDALLAAEDHGDDVHQDRTGWSVAVGWEEEIQGVKNNHLLFLCQIVRFFFAGEPCTGVHSPAINHSFSSPGKPMHACSFFLLSLPGFALYWQRLRAPDRLPHVLLPGQEGAEGRHPGAGPAAAGNGQQGGKAQEDQERCQQRRRRRRRRGKAFFLLRVSRISDNLTTRCTSSIVLKYWANHGEHPGLPGF